MDDMNCTGDEDYLEECEFPGWGEHNCSHSEDAAAVCQPKGFVDDTVIEGDDLRIAEA